MSQHNIQTDGVASPSPDEMERKDFSLPQISLPNSKNGHYASNTGYGAGQTEQSNDMMMMQGRSGMSPTLNSANQGISARNAFGGRRYTEVNHSIVAGIKMREQQQILKDQIFKNQALENRIKRLAFE